MIDPGRYERLAFARRGRILTVAMNRPEARNAVDRIMHRELARVFADIAADAETDIVVLTGAGKAFCAGGDIAWMRESASGGGPEGDEGKKIVMDMLDLERPVIARINGDAVGLGATLALLCDTTFAAESARIGDPHVRVGLAAGDGGALAWPMLVGYARAKRYLFTGDLIGAREAERIGLVNACVADADLDATVDAFADTLAGGAQLAIRATKAAVNVGLRRIAQEIMDVGLAREMANFKTADHKEAVAAFLEKRKPRFSGR